MNKINLKRMLVLCVLVCFSATALSQQLELFDGNGIPTMEATGPEKFDPSFLRKLRAEIQAEQTKEHQSNEKLGWYKSVNKRFVPESATFAIAGGGVYFLTLMAKTNSDPALMVKHIESLKDPIAHVSFYAFMAANGMYINFKTKGMDPETKQLAMKSLQYKGMAAGSLASSITADVVTTFSECTKGWINNKNDEQSYAACDETLKTWTLRNKFSQYAPQILSLIVSQYASDAVDWGKDKVTKNKFSVAALQKTEASALKLFKISEASIDIVMTAGGGIVVKSIAWIGKLTKFGIFLSVDHLLTPSIMRIGNNILQPFFFQFDVNKLDRLMNQASEFGWSSEKSNQHNIECPVQNAGCKSFDELPKEIENFTYRMQQWRLHQNSKVENDLNGWLSETNKLLHQIDFSKNFYRTYLENLYDTLHRATQVQNGDFKSEPDRAWSTKSIYPYRTLPLYGVKTGKDYKGEKENDLYLRKPWLLQTAQSQHLKTTATEYLIQIKLFYLDSFSEKIFSDILIGLQSESVTEQAKFLIQIIDPIRTFEQKFKNNGQFLDPKFLNALRSLKNKIGNPMPVLDQGAGFSQAFIANSENYLTGKTAKFSLDNGIYRFNKPTDLMFYNMICGDSKAQVNEGVFSGLNFMPPRISLHHSEGLNLCQRINGAVTTDNLYKILMPLGQKNVSATEFLISNIDQKLLGNITDSEGQSGFNQWWAENTIPVVQNKFINLDSRYQTLVSEAYGNILDQRTFLDFSLDYSNFSKRLGGGMLDNMNFELEFYISSLDHILNQKKITTANYIDSIIEKSKDETANPDTLKILDIKKSYKNLMRMLTQSDQIDFKKIESLSTELKKSMDGIFEKLKSVEQNSKLPAEVKSIFSIKKGLEALEMDLKRYLFLKVNLANRLEIDTAEMNEFLSGQKMNKVHTGSKLNGK